MNKLLSCLLLHILIMCECIIVVIFVDMASMEVAELAQVSESEYLVVFIFILRTKLPSSLLTLARLLVTVRLLYTLGF